MVYIYKDKESLVGFDIVLVNKAGALESITSIAKDCRINIYYIEIQSLTRDRYDLFVICDFNGSKCSPEEFINELKKKVEYVKEIVISPEFKNIIFPSVYKPMKMGFSRAIAFPEVSMKGLITMIKKNLGVDPGNTLLYYVGYGIGQKAFEMYIKPLDIRGIEDLERFFVILFRGSRWGDVSEFALEDDKIILKLVDLWEFEIQKGTVDKPASHLFRGILAGFFGELIGKKVDVKETKCIALGDPYCQFEISIT